MTHGRVDANQAKRRAPGTPWRGACAWAVVVLVLAAVADPDAARRTPYHEHVVVGGTAAERARALVAHARAMVGHPPGTDVHGRHEVPGHVGPSPADGRSSAAGPSASSGPEADDQARVRVLVLRAGGPAGPAVFGTGGGAVLVSASPRLLAPRPFVGTVAPPWAPVPDAPPTTPDPPPRAA
jgi:hypothetical protein